MSEVKRYHRSINLEGITKVYEVVLASDYDIALSQLAALREELAEVSKENDRLDTANVELDETRKYLQQRLADAERRHVDISILLREAFDAGDSHVFGADLHERLEAALNKPEEAKS